jgi:hypothetical protein
MIRYCNLKEEALDRTLWGSGFGRNCGPVVRQTAGSKESVGCETDTKQINKPCCPNDVTLNVKVCGTYTYHLLVMN